ncbi:MAG TPA: SDR family NAD(P)-dependent oxidoreductase [Nocardioidaceae bacterium]|nr:SDR family NAD(P)-dependent oxidoreductase [Nocardioidaceae bacterium]
MSGGFEGKVALVTGASSGLGAAVTRKLASEGATVYAVARDRAKLESVADSADGPGKVVVDVLDVSDPTACKAVVAACVDQLGRLDVLVNNAGRHDFAATPDVTEEQWFHDLNTNLSGAFFLSQAAIPHLLESHGNIVNVASLAGVVGEAYSAAYTSAKHGLVGLTKALAVEYVRSPLRVNCVCPGGMDTPQVHTIQTPADADWDLIMRIAALRGFMKPEDVANVVAFLASDDAAAVHGSIQVVDAGHTAG